MEAEATLDAVAQKRHVSKRPPPPDSPVAIARHALVGGLRTYAMAHGTRGALDFLLRLFVVLRKRKGNFIGALRRGFLGKDAIRFGIAFGGFSFLWKLVNNSMRYARGKDDRWNGLVAGSIAGISVLAEKPERRITIAQQAFVRALQAAYSAGHAREYFHVPHGDSLLFMITCAQVLYAYTMQPKTIPKSFLSFMIQTARVPASVLRVNREHMRGTPINIENALRIVKKLNGTPHAFDVVSKMSTNPTAIPCELIHPAFDSCLYTGIERFCQVFRAIFPVYTALNFVTIVALKLKHFMQDPKNLLFKGAFNTARSSAFLATFVTLYQAQVCSHRNLVLAGLRWHSKYLYWWTGLVTGASIFVEDRRRRVDLALYVLPKAAESWYKIMYQRNWIFELHRTADVWFFSAAMGIIMAFYQHEPQVVNPFVKTILHKFVGHN